VIASRGSARERFGLRTMPSLLETIEGLAAVILAKALISLVGRVGIEPATDGSCASCSASLRPSRGRGKLVYAPIPPAGPRRLLLPMDQEQLGSTVEFTGVPDDPSGFRGE
jgi:hypothetical protein